MNPVESLSNHEYRVHIRPRSCFHAYYVYIQMDSGRHGHDDNGQTYGIAYVE